MNKSQFITVSLLCVLSGFALAYLWMPEVHFGKLICLAALFVFPAMLICRLGFKEKEYGNLQLIEQLQELLLQLENGNFEVTDSNFRLLQEKSPALSVQLLKIHNLYESNKQFTQNAAHELQTPLAVIKAHAESLLQAPNLSERAAESIGAILQNINRLSRLNSTLILLSKIEHGRFLDEKNLNLGDVIIDILEQFEDMIDAQGLTVERSFSQPFMVKMSATLAEILVANLIQNAIRHNIENGKITIFCDQNGLTISNTGIPLKGNPADLFKRFYRESHKEEGLGLGLSIVKRITDQCGLKVEYDFESGVHTFSIGQ